MSHESNQVYYASGVFKVDYKSAWYKELRLLAQRWVEDKNFYFLEVRKVSNDNRGLQFVYYLPSLEGSSEKWEWPMRKKYNKELKDLYGEGFYAWDFYECDTPPQENVFVSKALPLI